MKPSTSFDFTTESPVAFVIGPGRSGTTLLYKLLCLHPEVAYLSNVEHRLPWLPAMLAARVRVRRFSHKLEYWFQPGGNAYQPHRPLLHKLVPTPIEGESVYRRYGLSARADVCAQKREIDPVALRHAFDRTRRASGKALFVSKRTANNRRLPTIHGLFPHAKYVNIRRDGRDVAASLSRVEWWNNHPLWWDPQLRTPLQASAAGEDMLRLCAHNWVAETLEIRRGLVCISPAQVYDLQFEHLVSGPVTQMGRLLDFLGLRRSAEYDRAISSLRLSFQPGDWQRMWSPDQMATVNKELAPHLARQGYAT